MEQERLMEARRLFQEEQQRQKVEEGRRRDLENQAAGWRQSQTLLECVDEVERQVATRDLSDEQQEAGREWLKWAREHAERLNPLSSHLPFEETDNDREGPSQ